MRTSLKAFAIASVMGISIAGVGAAVAQDTSIGVAWWGEGDQNQRTQAALDAFTEETGIQIEPQATNFSGYFERLATQVAARNAPDVFQLSMPTLAEYAERGAIAPLDGQFSAIIDTTAWAEVAVSSIMYDGQQMFVPLGLATYAAIIIDLTVMEELGMSPVDPNWTMDEFREYTGEISRRLTEQTGEDAWGTDDLGGVPVVFEAWLRSMGKDLFTAEGELGFTEADLAEWLTFWDEMREDGIAVPLDRQEGGGFQNSPIIHGTAPIDVAYSSKGIQGYAALTENDLGFVPVPRANEDAQRVSLTAPVEWMVVSANSENVEEAARLVNFLANDPASFEFMGVAKGAPVSASLRRQMMESGELSEIERLIYENVEESLSFSGPRNVYPAGSSELLGVSGSLLDQLNDQVGFDQLTVEEAVERFFAQSRRALR